MGNTVGGDDMSLSAADWERLDRQFEGIRGEIKENRIAADIRLNQHSDKINAVSAGAVKAITEAVAVHEDSHHNPSKKWGLWASVMAVAGTVGGFFAWLVSWVKKGGP